MGTKEKNKKGLSIAKVYLSKQILIILCIVAVVLVAWFGTRKVVSIDNKTTKLGFENIGELATQEAYCTEVNVTDESKVVEAYISGISDGSCISLRQVSEEFGITLMKTRKILITAGIYHTENSEQINSMRKQGMNIPEIMKATGLSKSSVDRKSVV